MVLLCFAMALNLVLWLMRARARQSDSELQNSQTSKSTWCLARAAVSDNLKACLAADLGFKEIHVDARACNVMAARGAGSAAGPAPSHQPSESAGESAWGTEAIYIYCNYYWSCKHAGSVLVVKAAGCYAHDCGFDSFEAAALHGVSFFYCLFKAEWNCICHMCTWYIHGLNMYVHKHKSIWYFSNLPVQPSWP